MFFMKKVVENIKKYGKLIKIKRRIICVELFWVIDMNKIKN